MRAAALACRSLPLGPLVNVVEPVAGRLGPRIQPDKADQLRRNIERVEPGADDELGAMVGRGFGSYGRYWVESFRMPYLTDRTIDRGFSTVGYGKIEEVRASGIGPILVLPHLGGWEWAAAWLGRVCKLDVTAVVERLEPEEVFDWFARLRQAYGVNVVPLGPRAMVEVSAAVKRRDVVCLLSDRDIGGNGVEVTFFGETTTLPVGPALLARRTGAPLLPTAVYFRGRQRVGMVGDPIWPDQFSHDENGQKLSGREINQRLTQVLARRLEELIVDAPDQWHMLGPNWPSDRT